MGYTTDDLITSIKKRGIIPTSQKTFETADFIRFMDEELTNAIVPGLMDVRENYFLAIYDQALQSGVDAYQLHPRAIGMKLKNLYVIKADNTQLRLYMRNIDELPSIANPNFLTGSDPFGFYFIDNTIHIINTPTDTSNGDLLRQYYYLRRNTLVPSVEVGVVTAINTGTNTVTVNSLPAAFTNALLYDIVKGTPSFSNRAMDLVVTSISGSDITFSATLPTDTALGDSICLAGQSNLPQIPVEMFPILSQRTLIRCLRANGDAVGSQNAIQDLAVMENSALSQFKVRADDQSKKVVSPTGISNYVFNRHWGW